MKPSEPLSRAAREQENKTAQKRTSNLMKGMFNMGKKYVYLFSEGNAQMRDILGGKGANLAEMTNIGLPVPQGFTVSTEACTRYYEDCGIIAQDILDEIAQYVSKTEEITGKKFGDPANPLLVSVRSGSRASMPGMMDTILNLGLNREVAEGLAALTGNERFAYDSYRRFIQMFSDVVMGLPKSSFEKIIDQIKAEKGVKADTELTAADMRRLTDEFLAHYRQSMGKEFPTDAREQLIEAVKAVFRSWNNERAIVYRRMNDIPSSWGTAVNVQAMVFGNMGDTSGTGVAFTRDPATGENRLYGEFLMNAQGEDVVAGIRTPQPISALKEVMPEVYTRFTEIASTLEKHYRDMQDMEFTIENRKLYMLQTRNGKRTAAAALKIAVDLVAEGLLSTDEALLKVEPCQLDAPSPAVRRQGACSRQARSRRLARLTRRGCRKGPLHRRGRKGRGCARRKNRPRAAGDLARRHRRHVRLRGHPHRARRTHFARGGCRARYGPLLRSRLRRHPNQRARKMLHRRRPDRPRGRQHLH